MKLNHFVYALPFIVIPISSIADNLASASNSIQKYNIYFGMEAAYIRTNSDNSSIKNSLTNALGGSPSIQEDRNIGAGRFFGGYRYNENIAVEIAYLKTGKESLTFKDNLVGYSGSGSASLNGLELSTLLSPSQYPNFFVKAGATYMRNKGYVSFNYNGSTYNNKATENGLGYVVGAGYKYPITDMFDIRATYAFYGNAAGESSNHFNMISIGGQVNF